MYLIPAEADGYIKKNGNKYLTFASTGKNKKVFKRYTELQDKIKYQIKIINGGECNFIEEGDYRKDYRKIKFSFYDNLLLNKLLKLHMLTIIVRSVFEEDAKYYPQFFLDECLYEL